MVRSHKTCHLLGISVVYFQWLTLNALDTEYDMAYNDDLKSDGYDWPSPMNHAEDLPTKLKLLVKQFAQLPLDQQATSTYQGEADIPSSDHSLAPFLMPVYVVPTENLYIGSIVSNKALLTSCSSTVVSMGDGTFLYVKAEQLLVVLHLTIRDRVTPVMTGVMEVRRHPTCDQPYLGGPWKNDVALLLLPIAVVFKPNVLEPIKLPSLDFFEIYTAIKEKVWSNTTCHAVIMKYQGEELPRIKTLLPVKIRKSSGCPRKCGYMIDQCTQELGGYSIHLVNASKMNLRDASHGAAIVCDGRIYGVLKPDFTCGYDSFGNLPKPEAMLYMYVNFADPDMKAKPIVGSNSSERNGSTIAVYSIMLSWVIALSMESVVPMMYGLMAAVVFMGDDGRGIMTEGERCEY